MKLIVAPLVAIAASLMTGCALTPDSGSDFNRRYIDNYYQGRYYIAEYYIGDINRPWCNDGYCYRKH